MVEVRKNRNYELQQRCTCVRLRNAVGIVVVVMLSLVLASAAYSAPQKRSVATTIPPGISKGSISLSVRDVDTGYALPATVTITSHESESSESPLDTFRTVAGETLKTYPAGTYTITLQMEGYRTAVSSMVIEPGVALRGRYMLSRFAPDGERLQRSHAEGAAMPSDIALVSGYVTDDDTGRPLQNVRVVFESSGVATTTDTHGYYRAAVPVHGTLNVGDQKIPAVRESVAFTKDSFTTRRETGVVLFAQHHSGRNVVMVAGGGEIVEDRTPRLLLAPEQVEEIERLRSADADSESHGRVGDLSSPPPAELSMNTVQPPSRIRVGFSSTWGCCTKSGSVTCAGQSCGTCTQYSDFELEDYVSRGWVGSEWLHGWGVQSLRSGSIAYRSYGASHVVSPDGHSGSFYDVCSSCVCQMFSGSTGYTSKKTAGILLQRGGSILHAEYSAENNNYCSTGTCTGGGFNWASCGDGSVGRPPDWPCLYDEVGVGRSLLGHGGGMSQWGGQRWDVNRGKLWPWIVNHYYNANGGADGPSAGYRTAYMTSPIAITAAVPAPAAVNVGQTFTISIGASNYAGLAHEQILVGASLYSASRGHVTDALRDSKVVLTQGSNNVSRSFVVPGGTASGTYDLVVTLWLDVNENNVIDPAVDLAMHRLTRNAAVTVGAEACYTFAGIVSPAGSGSVTSSAANCVGGYTPNTAISITANPSSGYAFSHWSASGGTLSNTTANPATLTITGNAAVTAYFYTVPANGAITANATLDGVAWSGNVNLSVNGPSYVGFGQVPVSVSNQAPGTYTMTYNSGGPPGASLASITPSASQTLGSGGAITFTLNFVTPAPTTGTINVTATRDGAPWSGRISLTANAPGSIVGFSDVPRSVDALRTGSYTLTYNGGGPEGATLSNITPSATQNLTGGGTIAFTVNFVSNATPMTVVPGDFDGDRRSDLVWRKSSDGQNALWLMNGISQSGGSYLPSLGASWSLGGIGDFDGDRRNDLLWRNGSTGDNAIWLMNGAAVAVGTYAPNAAPNVWSIGGVGDFDGDGKSDILWRDSSTSAAVVWLMNGASVRTASTVAAPGSAWAVAGVGDFNADSKADILWRDNATAAAAIWLMNGAAIASANYVASPSSIWTVEGVGDFDNDLRTDILWRHGSTYETVIWLMNGLSIKVAGNTSASASSQWDVQAAGDFNGDGTSDLMWRNTSTGENAIWLMNGLAVAGSGYTTSVPDLGFNVIGPR